MMKRSKIPKRPAASIFKIARPPARLIALAVVLTGLGLVLAQAQLWGSATASSASDMVLAINQAMQPNSSSGQSLISGPNGCQASSISIGDGWAYGQVYVGSTPCPCPEPACPDGPVISEPGPCDPFADLMGKWVTIRLDGDVVVAGMLQGRCAGFLILAGQEVTYTVNIAKIIVIES